MFSKLSGQMRMLILLQDNMPENVLTSINNDCVSSRDSRYYNQHMQGFRKNNGNKSEINGGDVEYSAACAPNRRRTAEICPLNRH
jgi:hypothetical protein